MASSISTRPAASRVHARRSIRARPSYTFALGSKSLYETLHRNPDILCYPVDHTNAPHLIMQNDRVVSINNTTQIDLQGQAASESDGHRHISGTGGQLQFVRGAYASKGGQVVHLPVFDLRQARRAPQPHRAQSHLRQHRDHAPLRRDVCRHRVRHGQPEGKDRCPSAPRRSFRSPTRTSARISNARPTSTG